MKNIVRCVLRNEELHNERAYDNAGPEKLLMHKKSVHKKNVHKKSVICLRFPHFLHCCKVKLGPAGLVLTLVEK
jgi:hypothetical protein